MSDYAFWVEKAGQARWKKEHDMLDRPVVTAKPDMSDYTAKNNVEALAYFEGKAAQSVETVKTVEAL